MRVLKIMQISFPTSKEYTADDIKKVQQELLGMTKIITQILEQHDIPYFIAFGTLIGAVKLQGFLPWDDDIDLFLFDDSYDKAIYLLEEFLPKHLVVHGDKNDPNYFLAWNSVKNINTSIEIADIYHPHNKLLGYKCLGVDLYRLKKVKKSSLEHYKYEETIKFFKRKLDQNLIANTEYQQEVSKLTFQFNKKEINVDQDEEVFTFVVKMKKPIPINAVLPLKKINFEDTQFFAPNVPGAVLECSFHDLDKIPSFEDRKPHIQSVKFLDKV